MKSVLISTQPKRCHGIADGKKPIEVRKTRPKIETPFKCYIYCTMGKVILLEGHRTKAAKETFWMGKSINGISPGRYVGNGMVIGEFVCDCITPLYNVCTDDWSLLRGGLHEIEKQLVGMACLTEEELHEYANGKYCYAWHISDLKIYDKPRELSEFWAYNEELHKRYDSNKDFCCYDGANEYGEPLTDCGDACENILNCYRCWEEWSGWCHHVTRPPQSWMYVEELP